jgi:hypothetical protein
LNLVKSTAALVGKFRKRSAQIMGGNVQVQRLGACFDYAPNRLRVYLIACYLVAFVHRLENIAGIGGVKIAVRLCLEE